MPVQLDHVLVPARDRNASAERLAHILGVPWSRSGVGPFSPVYASEDLTLDFDDWGDQPLPKLHFCFRVGDAEFDAILERLKAAALPFRSTPHGPVDYRVNTGHGGRIVYWNEPDGHMWEALTVSYARQPGTQGEPT